MALAAGQTQASHSKRKGLLTLHLFTSSMRLCVLAWTRQLALGYTDPFIGTEAWIGCNNSQRTQSSIQRAPTQGVAAVHNHEGEMTQGVTVTF